jgi:16S rRNA (adenine1518-N6/adenine1519-N6)-dimethyltransferase
LTDRPHPKRLLEGTGVVPKHSFGQNFLADESHLDVIARLSLSLARGTPKHVVELGGGLGALTAPLLDLGRAQGGVVLHVVERDRDLVPLLAKRFADAVKTGDVVVHEDNALTIPLDDKVDGNGAIVGNLPYHLAADLALRALDLWPRLGGACFLVQKEVAERIAAGPGSKDFGVLSIYLQSRFDVELAHVVPAGAFWPPPDVDGGVFTMRPLAQPRGSDASVDALKRVVKPAFLQRRKTIKKSLSRVVDAATLEEAGIDPGARPEDVAVDAWQRLAALAERQTRA